ncbi:hypothetical protein [Natrarchaeobaculum aegyptiacum]|uniref:Uncharacterized protein n=1 Tax=Natrarchaeobaculum aegyptiacum TaxID=745377 RepID=A0A2Z2HVR0_9EURY|nr:hypothetical protein [Natrarchaeobaculum aegyptiacum]ARS91302.1 hypothetical protein B1756_17285 [Natrarchaeobaculum aegyptiacum]
MVDESSTGSMRLRASGVGVVVGGSLLGGAATIVSFWLAAALVIVCGGIWMVIGDRTDAFQGSIGVIAVGAIGLLEAIPGIGLGVDPIPLAAFAIVFGCFDAVAGLILGHFSNAVEGS